MRGLAILCSILVFHTTLGQQSVSCSHHISDSVCADVSFSGEAEDFVEPVLAAAAAFHELSGVHVEIQRRGIKSMMAARPKAGFLFKKKENREYVIIISDREDMNAEVLYGGMSTCAQTGVIGHEFSHILSYESMTNMQLLWFGIKYAFNRKQVEAETDLMAIKKGFGKQIIEFNQYLHRSPRTNKKYLQKKKKYYLTSYEIEQKILENL